MSIADEARAEAERRFTKHATGYPSRRVFVEGAEWQASRKPEAAPSDTDREALAELMYLTRQREIGATIMGWSWKELGEHYPAVTATWMAVADAVLAAGFSRTSQPVHVEVTEPRREGACREKVSGTVPSWAGEDQIDPCRCALPVGHDGSCKCSHDLAALGGGDHAE